MTTDNRGKKLAEIMQNFVLTVNSEKTVMEAVREMNIMNVGSIIVVDDAHNLVGLFSERDLLTRVVGREKDPSTTQIKDVMTMELQTLGPDNTIDEAFLIMMNNTFRHLPIIEQGKLKGIVSIKDLSKYM